MAAARLVDGGVMLLLALDQVELWQPGGEDGHGWREPPDGRPNWTGQGCR